MTNRAHSGEALLKGYFSDITGRDERTGPIGYNSRTMGETANLLALRQALTVAINRLVRKVM